MNESCIMVNSGIHDDFMQTRMDTDIRKNTRMSDTVRNRKTSWT